MSKFKVGDRVRSIYSVGGFFKGNEGTIVEENQSGWPMVNTDKLNDYNHKDYGGNGIYFDAKLMELIPSLPTVKRWSKNDLDILHSRYRRDSIKSIAESLGRTYYAVQSKARSEGIHKHPRREYNDRDNRFIRHTYMDNWKPSEIARQLHRSKSSIDSRLSLMNERELLPTIPKEID